MTRASDEYGEFGEHVEYDEQADLMHGPGAFAVERRVIFHCLIQNDSMSGCACWA